MVKEEKADLYTVTLEAFDIPESLGEGITRNYNFFLTSRTPLYVLLLCCSRLGFVSTLTLSVLLLPSLSFKEKIAGCSSDTGAGFSLSGYIAVPMLFSVTLTSAMAFSSDWMNISSSKYSLFFLIMNLTDN